MVFAVLEGVPPRFEGERARSFGEIAHAKSAPSLEGWLLEYLERLERAYPGAREVEILGLWAGNPPRLERLARVRVQPKEGYLSSPSGCENANG